MQLDLTRRIQKNWQVEATGQPDASGYALHLAWWVVATINQATRQLRANIGNERYHNKERGADQKNLWERTERIMIEVTSEEKDFLFESRENVVHH